MQIKSNIKHHQQRGVVLLFILGIAAALAIAAGMTCYVESTKPKCPIDGTPMTVKGTNCFCPVCEGKAAY